MKNLIILINISLLILMSCNDDYLEKFPLDEVNDATYWKSATDIEMYANQFYPSLKAPHYIWRNDNNSDNQGASARPAYIWGESIVPSSGGGWDKSDWLPIRRCNYALARIADMEKDDMASRYEGEIRFFKAFFYHQKVKRYGDVPWFDTDLQTDSEELYKPRDSRKVVFANMMADLDFAIANLPETSSGGRLSRYAALAFKSEACLYEGTFRKYHGLGDHEAILREAVNAAESVINSGLFSVYSTGKPDEDYFDLFVQYDLRSNQEGIMVQHFAENKRMHNNVRELGEQETGYSKDFVNSYLCSDGLPISLSSLYNGDAIFGDEFANRDPRMQQSVYNTDRVYRIFPNGNEYYKPMPEFNSRLCMTSYYILKGYSPYEADREQHHSIIDNFIYRYGKLLIEYAEAKAELGECTQGVLDKSVNLLRDRVSMPHLTVDVGFVDPYWPDWEASVSPLINEIRRERRIELCGEGIRWDDLMRWKAGKRLEEILTYKGARDPETDEYRVLYPGFTRTWYDKLYLHPLPTQEIILNPSLVQNPGWE